MPILRPFLGLARFPIAMRRALCAQRAYGALRGGELRTVAQPILCIRDQERKPSCVGQATAGRLESTMAGSWQDMRLIHSLDMARSMERVGAWTQVVSAVDIWRDARRRQGDLPDAYSGTYAEMAFESVCRRGWSPYCNGEDSEPIEDDIRMPDMQAELAAHDHRVHAIHHTLSTLADVVAALEGGHAVVYGDGRREAFFSLGLDEVATESHLGGDENGHAEGIAMYLEPVDEFVIQGSWGVGFAGCTLPCDVTFSDGSTLREGSLLPGCYRAKTRSVLKAWSLDSLEPVPYAQQIA